MRSGGEQHRVEQVLHEQDVAHLRPSPYSVMGAGPRPA
jgi:hypothetical protein